MKSAPLNSRKAIINRETIIAALILSIIYAVACYFTDTKIDPFVMSLAFGAIGGSTMTHHWANAQEHKAKSNQVISGQGNNEL